MLNKTFSILFFLRAPKKQKAEGHIIYVRFTIDEVRVEISTKRFCQPSKWNSKTGRAIGNKDDIRILNAYLDTFQSKVYNTYTQLMQQGKTIDATMLKQELLGIAEKKRMILEIFKHHNDQLKALVGNTYAPLTYKRYNTALGHTKEFIQWKYQKEDLEISKLDYEFISDYEFYLKSVRKCAHNSSMKYLSNFKKIVLICVKKGWLVRDPFYGFKLAKKEVIKDFLSEQELHAIEMKSFATQRLALTRDIFLFSCYTGLAYVDVFKLRRSDISIGVDGKLWILTKRQKTEVQTRLPLLPVSLKILEKYKDHPQCVVKNKVLPVWSNQKLNEYLKEIADVCAIPKRLTYHVARHTFATTVTLNNGVPIETVSRMLGHKTIRTTQHYAKLLDKKISEDMEVLEGKLRKTDCVSEGFTLKS